MMKLEVIEHESDLNPVLRDWERLNTVTPMQSPTWMLAWWQAFRTSGDRLRIVIVRDESDAAIGLAPWYVHTSPGLGTTIKFLGDGRACSDYQTILCQAGSEASAVRTLAEWLSTGKPAASMPWDLLDLDGVATNDATMNLFVEQMATRGHITHRRDGEHTWKLNIAGGWEAFVATQSKTQRGQSRNLVNRFEKSPDLQLRLASDNPATAEAFIATVVELHEMRWRSVGKDGCFADARMEQFFTSAMRNLIAAGTANIVVVERSGRPVAAQAWLIRGTELFMYQCGRDPAEDANRMGRIANLVGIRWASEQGYQVLDYLRGDETYKAQLRATPIRCQRVRIVARAGLPQLRHNIWLACRELKSRWRQLRRSDGQGTQATSQPAATDEATST